MTEWFQDEAFWRETYSFLFTEDCLEEPEKELDHLKDLNGVKQGRVLDLCCGPGRWSITLARHRFEVTGVDRTAFLLDKARERAGQEKIEVEWVSEDMRSFVRENHYDLIINMFSSFGYFENKGDDRLVLKNMLLSLKPGGGLVIQTMSKEVVARIFQPTISYQLPDGGLLVERPEIIEDWTRIKNEWMIVRGDRVQRFQFIHNIYSGQELRDLLLGAGFSTVNLYGGLDGRDYGSKAERLVAVAFKSN